MRTRPATALTLLAALTAGAGTLWAQDTVPRGQAIFNARWAPAGRGGEFTGLGPLFNVDSCAACHINNGRGPAPRAGDTNITAVVTKFAAADDGRGEETLKRYGNRLNYQAVAGVPVEGQLTVAAEAIEGRFADGERYTLQRPVFGFAALTNGNIEPGTLVAVRMAPPLAGLGLLQQVPDDWIRDRAASNAKSNGPVKGKPNQVWDPAAFRMTIGRFGWKADQPTLPRIIAAAFITDMGLTSRLFPFENCGELQPACKAAAAQPHPPEVDDATLDAVSHYVASLQPSEPRHDAQGETGRVLFDKAGCSSCHVLRVPLADKGEISPYTDLLLHDMGDGLADGMTEAAATGREWRTAPLWGLGQARRMSERPGYLHDGRARNPSEAILWHGGEAQQARDNYVKLDAKDRAALLAFLDQL